LDDHRVYELLMGGAIYDNPLVATRELVQNAVDACKLRDAQKRLYEPEAIPNTTNRITIRYEEPTDQCQQPKLTIIDTGTGMDKWILENYFLKVGRSYYNSSDFNKIRFQLRTKSEELDFAPISEFGIGFLSCFLIADRLQVTTAMWESIRGDTIKRTLIIDGPTRLIRISEQKNEGLDRFKGTSVTLYLSRGCSWDKNKPPFWDEIKRYLKDICQDLPYCLNLEYLSSNGHITKESIDRIQLGVQLPQQFESMAVRIPVDDQESGLEGEISIISPYLAREFERNLSEQSPVSISKQTEQESVLLRGGFKIGAVPGLPRSFMASLTSQANLRFNWKYDSHRRYPMPNLARNCTANSQIVSKHVVRLWLSYLLSNIDKLPEGLLYNLRVWRINILDLTCLEEYDALTIYKLARQGWSLSIGDNSDKLLESWENCTGESCYLGSSRDHLYWELLDIILPKITTLQMATQTEFYVKPPNSNWRKILGEWRNFITSPVTWGPFVEYIGNIENLLYYEYPGSIQLNSRFRERVLISFNEDELVPLLKILHEISDARGYGKQAILTDDKIALLKRAQEYLGDLEIGGLHGSWRIDSFAIPQS
ncbi:MAG: ATP-binding protein, partial [Planctomycetota bacterium]|nr:ATP-binding protein [Planctomycetota bacterium]